MEKYMKIHKVADMFPMMGGDDFNMLKQDIKENGLLNPIWTYEDKIIDGRNRMLACKEVGVKPRFKEWDGKGSLVAFVVSLNLHRRHLSPSQCAVVALNVLPELEKEAKKRQGSRTDITANLPESDKSEAREQAAEMFNISPRIIADAKKIQKERPEDIKDIFSGEKTVNAVVTEIKKAHVSHNSGENEWYTPTKFINSARKVMGEINLDPASCPAANKTVKAKKIFTKDDDGLTKEWRGNIWMNPPYAQPLIGQFCEKLYEEYCAGYLCQACVLVNNATETKWFAKLVEVSSAVCFPQGRIKFIDKDGNPGGAPLQGQAILYIENNDGENVKAFLSEFGQYGSVWLNGDEYE